jgi:adenosylcobinamide-phosphate synthase
MPLDAWVVLAALAIEAACGYPSRLQILLPHPVRAMGLAIGSLEHRWNDPGRTALQRQILGVLTLVLVAGTAFLVGLVIQSYCDDSAVGLAVVAIVATPGLAQRSLYEHVADVARQLSAADVPAARTAVAKIVGRDTQALNEQGIAKAAIESLAESFNDAVVAPLFWLMVGGLPGLFAYKAINTADSMIGHMELRWRAFGWASARADDLANLVPAPVPAACAR